MLSKTSNRFYSLLFMVPMTLDFTQLKDLITTPQHFDLVEVSRLVGNIHPLFKGFR